MGIVFFLKELLKLSPSFLKKCTPTKKEQTLSIKEH
jgi:hypothetical protein